MFKLPIINSKKIFTLLAIAVLAVVFLSLKPYVFAATGIPSTINFQGKLVNNSSGINVTNASYSVVFTLYDKSSGGTALWTETQTVTTVDGIFRVALGSVTPIPSNFNFNWDGLYLGMKVGADSEMTPRIQMASVPFAFNAQKVAGLTVQDTSGNASTSGTLQIANAKTINLGTQNLTFTTTGDTTLTLPTAGTLLTNTATAVQTISSTQATGTVLALADSTGLSGAITGLSVGLTSSTNSQNKTGLSFDLSGGTGGTYYDILGTGSTWSITRAGALSVASCTGCGTGGGSNYWNLVSGNGVADGGYITPINSTADFLLGSQATSSAKFAFTGFSSLNNQTQASFSGQLIIMPNNGFGGKVGIGTSNPLDTIDITRSVANAVNAVSLINPSTSGNAYSAFRAGQDTTNRFVEYTYGNSSQDNSHILNIPNAASIWVASGATGGYSFAIEANAPIRFTTGGYQFTNEKLRIAGTGELGLGTTSPIAQLSVTRPLSFGATGKALGIFDQIETQDIFTASASGTTRFVITNDGNIGINMTNPSQKLDITHPNTTGFSEIRGTAYGVSGTSNSVFFTGRSARGTKTNPAAVQQGDSLLTIGGQGYNTAFDSNVPAMMNFFADETWSAANTIGAYISWSTTRIGTNTTTERVRIGSSGVLGLGTTTATSQLSVTRPLSWGATGKALISLDQIENQDIFTASASGTPVITISRAGGIGIGGGAGSAPNYGSGSNCLLGGTTVSWGSCGAGAGDGIDRWQVNNGVLSPGNQTVDVAIGGTATASAKYVFGVGNNGSPAIATFAANLMLDARSESSVYDQTNWQKISGTKGTVDGTTSNVASISAMTSYNGSLYVGTANPVTGAEVYRYNGGSSWTNLTFAAGQLVSGGTSGIASISAMTVYNGYLYIGTSKVNGAEVYRYNGGSSWVKVSGPTAGTFGSVTNVDGVASLAVYQGTIYAGIRETSAARLMIYQGGITWTSLVNTAGTFVATNTVGMHAVNKMVVKNGNLYLATQRDGDADVLRYGGGNSSTSAFYVSMDLASTTGSYLINGTATTGVNEITAMTVYNGAVIVGIRRAPGQADVLVLNDSTPTGGGASSPNTWTRMNNAVGQMTQGGTSSIDSITSLFVYNGFLYAGTNKSGSAEIYKYIGDDAKWIKVTQASAGSIQSGGTSGIFGVANLIQVGNDLFAGTYGPTSNAEIYKLSNVNANQSYALNFHANPVIAGGEQNGIDNLASIFFLASASANLGNSAGNTGAFIFSHGIQTRNGSYDVAEDYPTRDETLEAGDVVSIDEKERGFVKKSIKAYDYNVLGVYSTKPALRLTQDDVSIDGGHAVPVALAGRVPVKVSQENGEIKPGDYLTTSSAPGVAMKATKSSVVFAQAMEGYSGEGIGKVMSYIKSMTYQGSVAENFTNIDINSSNFASQALAQLMNQPASNDSSVITDRLIAGLEIITPTITADTIYAKTIKADRIEGLSIYTDSLNSLSNDVRLVRSLISSSSAVLGLSTASGELTSTSLSNLYVTGLATASADLNVKGNGLVEGMLMVLKSVSAPNLLVSDFASFFGDVVFKKNVAFEGRPTFNSDTAGFAVVSKGDNAVTVNFDEEYVNTPVVTVNIALDKIDDPNILKQTEDQVLSGDLKYIITQKSTKGFTIKLNKNADANISFSWIAVSVKNVKTTISGNSAAPPIPISTSSAAFQSIINQLLQKEGGGG